MKLLPREITLYIFSYLADSNTLATLRLCCKEFRDYVVLGDQWVQVVPP